jgi:hypothetical protein
MSTYTPKFYIDLFLQCQQHRLILTLQTNYVTAEFDFAVLINTIEFWLCGVKSK